MTKKSLAKSTPHVDSSAIERSIQAMRQLADVGIKVGGYSLGGKLSRDMPAPNKSPRQGPMGTVAHFSQLSE